MSTPTPSTLLEYQSGLALFSAVFHHHPEAVALIRISDGLVVDVNPAWLALTGYSRDEAVGSTTVKLGLWGAAATRHELLAPMVAGATSLQVESTLHAKGGARRAIGMDATRLLLDGEPHLLGYLRDITGRRDSADNLQEKFDFIQQLTSRVPVMLFQFRLRADGSAHFPYATAATQQLFGVDPQELVADGARVFAAVHPDDQEGVWNAIMASAQDLTPWRQEYRVNQPDGGLLWVYGDALPLRHADGSVLWHGAVTDITERKIEQAELLKAREQMAAKAQALQVALDNMSQGIVALDADLKLTLHNQNFVDFLDLPASLMQTANLSGADVVRFQVERGDFADNMAQVESHARNYGAMADQRVMLDHYLRKSLSGRTLEIKSRELPGGGVVRTYADVTHFVEAQAALHESELRFRSLTALSSDWYWEQDENFKFVRVDGSAFDSQEVSRAAYIGLLRWDGGDHGVSPEVWAAHRSVLQARQAFRNFDMQRPGGTGDLGVPGVVAWTSISGLPIFDGQGVFRGYRGIGRDITENRRNDDENQRLAFYDTLTGLPNRRLLLDRLAKALVTSARNHLQAALLFIDLDNFKNLNDTLGHDMGDKLLQLVAQRLAASVRQGDTVARFGGDEFVVMLENLNPEVNSATAQVQVVGEKILAALNLPFNLEENEHYSTPSIGIALFSGQQQSTDELLKRADLAMYQAKAAGRNTLRFFDPALQAAMAERVMLELDLRLGLERGELVLHYQPIVDQSGHVIGVEALARWVHPTRGMVQPGSFIPVAEESGLILPLGKWVMQTACRQLVAWGKAAHTQSLSIAVNVSAREFRQSEFASQIIEILRSTGANPRRLKLELTESLLLSDVQDAIRKMEQLRAEGVRFSLDDFGTGYSSLSYLKRLPLDQLKIDQSFVRDVLTDPNDAAIARTVIALAQSLGLAVVAEGVETAGQRDFLLASGCQVFQGYLFGRPVPVHELDLDGEPGRDVDRDLDNAPDVPGRTAGFSESQFVI